MKINAYILSADPAWIEASVLSYYDIVDRIVVSYDQDSLSWTGHSLDIEQCLRRLRAVDTLGKLDYRAGHYARAEYFRQPLKNETHQRQCALSAANEGADWVIQLDTDEILGDAVTFTDCLREANSLGRQALNFPSHWLYCQAFGKWYLEWCNRGWRQAASYPGPMAVRSGTPLILARRVENGHFHVDLSWRGSSGRVPNDVLVDKVIGGGAAIWHLSMVRDEQWLHAKFSNSGHAFDRDWHPEIKRWLRSSKHPLLRVITSQCERGQHRRSLRLSRIPDSVKFLIAKSSISDR